MKFNIPSKVAKPFKKLRALFPSALPIGVTAFNEWSQDIITLYDFPNNDSLTFCLATMVINLGQTSDTKSKHFFAKAVRASMAKQVAGQFFQDLKQKQMEAAKAEREALLNKPAEVTAPTPGAVTSSDTQK